MAKWIHRISDIDPEKMIATCTQCGDGAEIKRLSDRPTGKARFTCAEGAREWRRRSERKTRLLHPEKMRLRQGKKRNGKNYLPPQTGACPLCGVEGEIVFDHNHETMAYRGHICRLCNSMLGFARDRPDVLRAGADYLEA